MPIRVRVRVRVSDQWASIAAFVIQYFCAKVLGVLITNSFNVAGIQDHRDDRDAGDDGRG